MRGAWGPALVGSIHVGDRSKTSRRECVYIHTYIHTYIHACIHTCTHIRMYTYRSKTSRRECSVGCQAAAVVAVSKSYLDSPRWGKQVRE